MKTRITLTFILAALFVILSGSDVMAGKKKIRFVVSESDAKIYVNGAFVGEGRTELIINKSECIKVKVEKTGYLTEMIEFCNYKEGDPLPKDYRMVLLKDDAYNASEPLDIVNEDFEVKTMKTELEAWKLLSQIVTNYMDVIEVTDRETGYLRTAWETEHFSRNTIRTRVIIKLASTDPLSYKIKIVSEESGKPVTSVKDDEYFTEYNRVLKEYKDLISEMQSRLAN
ncbi:MAG: hypothetical protein HQ542_00495 [Bacteroidia bacterium]|nr:hypothetical protein [Bacteroidia bacterium]